MDLREYFTKISKKERALTAAIYTVAALLLLAALYGLMWLRCTAWNTATGDHLTVWEFILLPTRYTGPQ